MRNTLQEQYNLIKEGKGNKQQFFKSVRQLFPNLVTPINTYDDTVRILKNRGIITEGIGGVVTTGKKQDWHAIFNENMEKLKEKKDDEDEDDDDEKYKEEIDQYEKREKDIEKFGLQHLKHLKEDNEDKLNQAKKYYLSNPNYLELKDVAARFGVSVEDLTAFLSKSQDKAKSGNSTQAALQGIGLFEAKEAKAEEKETTKDVADMATRGYDYKDYKNIDNIFGETFLKGFYTEMQDPKNEDKTVEELKQIVAKNLAKDCLHYTKEGQFGIKGVGYTVDAPGLGEPKPAKGKHKSSGYGDLKESVLRSQIHLLVKEVLAEGENKDLLKHRLGVLKKALEIAKKDLTKVDKDGKAYKEVEKTIAAKKREIEALEKEVLDEVKQPELKAALDAANKAYDENKYDSVDDFLKTYTGEYKNEVANALKSKYEG